MAVYPPILKLAFIAALDTFGGQTEQDAFLYAQQKELAALNIQDAGLYSQQTLSLNIQLMAVIMAILATNAIKGMYGSM